MWNISYINIITHFIKYSIIYNKIRMKNIKLLELGNKIRLERMKRDLSQEKLAELANISVRTVSDIERGITDIRYTNLLQISEAFGLSVSELLNFKL